MAGRRLITQILSIFFIQILILTLLFSNGTVGNPNNDFKDFLYQPYVKELIKDNQVFIIGEFNSKNLNLFKFYLPNYKLIKTTEIPQIGPIFGIISDKDIIKMRSLHQQIDITIAKAYGWNDLDLEHDYYAVEYLPGNEFLRYTISEKARNEILLRLALLNKQRYEKEQLSAPKKAKSKPSPKPTKSADPTPQIGLFDEPAVDTAPNEPVEQKGNQWGTVSIDQILAWLESKAPNWYTKDAILTACGASPNDWDDAIKELLEDGDIESKNIDGITRYRAADWG